MAEARYRVLAICAHPVQYMAPILRLLVLHPGLDFQVVYCSLRGAEAAHDLESVLIFRLADEWLAIKVQVLVEVTTPRPIHRVPARGGLLAALVNIRGELHLCVHLAKGLGIEPRSNGPSATSPSRLLVVKREAERWVFPVDAVDQVHRVPSSDLKRPPATVGRSTTHLTRGVFAWEGQPIGLLDEIRLLEALRTKLR